MASANPVANVSTTIVLHSEYAHIPRGILVGVADGIGIDAIGSSLVLVDGEVDGTSGIELDYDASVGVWNTTIAIDAQAEIWGLHYGIKGNSGTGSFITNKGLIYSYAYGVYAENNTHTIVNTGTIEARLQGIWSLNAAIHVTNTGSIISDQLDSTFSYSIYSGQQWDTVVNSGHLVGRVYLGDGNDSLDTRLGSVAGTIGLGPGDDTAYGSAAADNISGDLGQDTIAGYAGNDTIDAGPGADSLDGGLGKDSLSGGDDADIFYFTTALSSSNVDTIVDFKISGADRIALDNAVMSALGNTAAALASSKFYAAAGATHGHDSSDRIVYNKSNGWLYYDSDGSGSHAAVHFATLVTHPSLSAGDFLVV